MELIFFAPGGCSGGLFNKWLIPTRRSLFKFGNARPRRGVSQIRPAGNGRSGESA